jgi:hypothetical protein
MIEKILVECDPGMPVPPGRMENHFHGKCHRGDIRILRVFHNSSVHFHFHAVGRGYLGLTLQEALAAKEILSQEKCPFVPGTFFEETVMLVRGGP